MVTRTLFTTFAFAASTGQSTFPFFSRVNPGCHEIECSSFLLLLLTGFQGTSRLVASACLGESIFFASLVTILCAATLGLHVLQNVLWHGSKASKAGDASWINVVLVQLEWSIPSPGVSKKRGLLVTRRRYINLYLRKEPCLLLEDAISSILPLAEIPSSSSSNQHLKRVVGQE